MSSRNWGYSIRLKLKDFSKAEGLREKIILMCGGPRISNTLAKETGFDAGFGSGTFAGVVSTFAIKELVKRRKLKE